MDGPAREMTLDEYMARLTESHVARRELTQLRAEVTTLKAKRDALRMACKVIEQALESQVPLGYFTNDYWVGHRNALRAALAGDHAEVEPSIISPVEKIVFSIGDRVRINPVTILLTNRIKEDRIGTIVGLSRRGTYPRVRWDGNAKNTLYSYNPSMLLKVEE